MKTTMIKEFKMERQERWINKMFFLIFLNLFFVFFWGGGKIWKDREMSGIVMYDVKFSKHHLKNKLK